MKHNQSYRTLEWEKVRLTAVYLYSPAPPLAAALATREPRAKPSPPATLMLAVRQQLDRFL